MRNLYWQCKDMQCVVFHAYILLQKNMFTIEKYQGNFLTIQIRISVSYLSRKVFVLQSMVCSLRFFRSYYSFVTPTWLPKICLYLGLDRRNTVCSYWYVYEHSIWCMYAYYQNLALSSKYIDHPQRLNMLYLQHKHNYWADASACWHEFSIHLITDM